MSSYYTVIKKDLHEILIIEQSMLYSIQLYDMNRTLEPLEISNLPPQEFEDLIVQLAKVYSYQHPGEDLNSLKEKINALL